MYGLFGKIITHPGQRDALISILLAGMTPAQNIEGCYLYVVGTAPDDENGIWVTEVWRSQADHQASLTNEAVKEMLRQGGPMIAGVSNRVEFTPLGGIGLPDQTDS